MLRRVTFLVAFLPIIFCLPITWPMLPFHKEASDNPIFVPNSSSTYRSPTQNFEEVHWEAGFTYNPSIVVKDDKIFMLYRAQEDIGTPSTIGLAVSEDGVHFERMFSEPVLYPTLPFKDLEVGGCEDPRVVQREDGTYIMMYTGYDGVSVARLMVATSKDLVTWKKYGKAFGDNEPSNPYHNDAPTWSKSAAIVSTLNPLDGSVTATKLHLPSLSEKPVYGMFFGDNSIYFALSEDLIHWKFVSKEDVKGSDIRSSTTTTTDSRHVIVGDDSEDAMPIINPRSKMFDSWLCESGPAALVTPQGILLVYNGANVDEDNPDFDPHATPNAYATGQLLVSHSNPFDVLDRLDLPFLIVDEEYESEGQVDEVVFVEGFAYFNSQFWLYYGTADTYVGVATKKDLVDLRL